MRLFPSRQLQFFRAIAVTLCAALIGCAVDQQKEVNTYRKVIDANVDRAQPAFLDGQPLRLRDALLLTSQNNENLDLSGEDYLQALIDKDRAFAGFLPTVDFVPTFSRTDVRGESTGRRGITDAPVVGRINLFNGFRDIANLRRAEHTIEQRREIMLDLQQTLLLDTATAFYDVLRAERAAEVLKSSLAVQDERLRDVHGRQQAGLARPLDVAQSEAQASATRVSLLQAQRDVANARAALAFLTGAAIENSPLSDEYRAGDSPETVHVVLEDALRQRRDLLAAISAAGAARQEVEIAIGQYYPSISLSASAFLSRQSTPTDSDWNALLSANLPIFSAGLIEADVRTAWSRYRQARLDESLLHRQIAQDLHQAYNTLVSSDRQLAELQVQLASAQDALRQAEESYRVGLATNLDRIVAQDQLLATQLQLASEQFNRKVFYLTLLRVSGTLLDVSEDRPLFDRSATMPATAPTSTPGPPKR